ncbi:MAG: TIM barrel protein, partial [Chloroflexi bacterium]|nr:TIM barrel protein [Chloroflexota bacterium]
MGCGKHRTAPGRSRKGRIYDWWEKERPGELKRTLQEHGVTMACLFQAGEWTEREAATGLLADAERWAAAVADLGGNILMLVPGRRRDAPPYSLDEFTQMAETMNRVGDVARRVGIQTAMHPHWGTVAETRLEIEVLLSQLDHRLVGFAPDTGQIAKGGADPIPLVARWAEIIQHVHL